MGIRIGIVGYGSFSIDFVKWFTKHPDVLKVVCAELVSERRDIIRKDYPDMEIYSSYEEMLKKADIDCVAIFTQRHLHGPMVLEALRAGKHVYSAVPIACSVDEIEQIIEAVKKTRLIYMMGETCYYYPCAIYCREQYKKGEFGRFVYGESQYYHDISEMYGDFSRSGGENWRRVAGIPPMFYPTHSISMLFSSIGEHALKVSCMGYRDYDHNDEIYGEGKNNWDNPFSNQTAIFQMSGGGVARINEFRRVGINKPSSYITCLYGDKGAYECSITQHTFQRGAAAGEPYVEYLDELLNVEQYVKDKHDGTMDMAHDPISVKYILGFAKIHDRSRLPLAFRNAPPYAHNNSHPFLVDDFVRAVVDYKLPPNNVWDSARYMVPGLIAHESSLKDGELMNVPDFGDPPSDWQRLTYEKKDYYDEEKD